MAKVLGVGGIFFTSPDPARLRDWYTRWLGIPADEHGAMFAPDAMPAGALTIFSPFPADTTYFAPATRGFMFNLVVDDLDAALAQVREGGARVVGTEDHDYGRFGWFVDPDGNKVELWQVPAVPPDAAKASA
jgi:catechol 2,3-dioxygenase-like lactoylglutathione lyase family enzyme